MENKTNKLKEALADMNTAQESINAKSEIKTKKPKKLPISGEDKSEVIVPKIVPKVGAPIDPDEIILAKLKSFVENTNSKFVINMGTPNEKTHVTAPAWDYLARLKGCHVEIQRTYDVRDSINKAKRIVYCTAALIENKSGKELSSVEMVAETDEQFIKNMPLSAAYGWAQTRAKCRAVQSVFGSYMSQIKVEMTPAEEIADINIDVEAI